MSKTATKEKISMMEIEVIGLGPSKPHKVVPEGNKVRIGEDTYIVEHEDVFQGPKGPRALVVKGRARAIPVRGTTAVPGDLPSDPKEAFMIGVNMGRRAPEVGSKQLDTVANNNLLEQFNSLARSVFVYTWRTKAWYS